MSWFDIFFHQGHCQVITATLFDRTFRRQKILQKCNSDPSQRSSSFNHSIHRFKVNFSVQTSNGPLSRSRVLLSILAGQSHWLDHCLIVYISITQPFLSDVGRSVGSLPYLLDQVVQSSTNTQTFPDIFMEVNL